MQKMVPFSLAIECRYPEQIAVCIARDDKGTYNPMTIGWFMPVSMKPPMLAIAVGKTRHTRAAIQASQHFVLSFLSEPQSGLARYFGTHTGDTCQKLEEHPCPTQPASRIDGLILSEAVANFECAVTQSIETGDHTVFFGEVVCAHVTDNPLHRMFTLTKSDHLDGVRQVT